MTDQPLFSPDYQEPPDTSTQVTRFPPIDAPCRCDEPPQDCMYPFCNWANHEGER
jgi:hypothetical protein